MDYKAIVIWALDDTDPSSDCIARRMMGLSNGGSYPRNSYDFGRCEDLLDAVPEFRERLHEMAGVSQYWSALVPRWNEIKESRNKDSLIETIIRSVSRDIELQIMARKNLSTMLGIPE